MLDLPGEVIAEAIGQFDLVERVLVEPELAARLPRARQLQLIKNAELHGFSSARHARPAPNRVAHDAAGSRSREQNTAAPASDAGELFAGALRPRP